MTGFHDDILKLIAKRMRLQGNHQHQQPIIHIKINLGKCYQLFEYEDWSGKVTVTRELRHKNLPPIVRARLLF